MRDRVFLLSPANCNGIRARRVVSDAAQFALAEQLRTAAGAPLGEVFAFVSGLYFRGKLAYAKRFSRPPDPTDRFVASGVLVITPNAGLRAADVASRYGGEEFCILLPQTALAEAGTIADRIRHRVNTTHYPHGKSQPLGRVTISVGVSTFSPMVNTSETIIAAADRALYHAKSLGKDRVEFYLDDGVSHEPNK